MNIEKQKEIVKEYTDQFGLVQHSKGITAGNGVRFTSEWILALKSHNAMDGADLTKFYSAIEGCRVVNGLYKRSPVNNDQEGLDDYVALVHCFYKLGDTGKAKKVLDYGLNTYVSFWGPIRLRFVYNNVNPNVFHRSAWFGRFPALVAHFHWCAGVVPNILLRVYAAISVAITGMKDHYTQDGYMLSWHLAKAANGRCFLMKIAYGIMKKRMLKYYPSFNVLLEKYFAHKHPIAVIFNEEA